MLLPPICSCLAEAAAQPDQAFGMPGLDVAVAKTPAARPLEILEDPQHTAIEVGIAPLHREQLALPRAAGKRRHEQHPDLTGAGAAGHEPREFPGVSSVGRYARSFGASIMRHGLLVTRPNITAGSQSLPQVGAPDSEVCFPLHSVELQVHVDVQVG